MAQEDNVLNARMAVASSRDSSSMKALAVITAIFLPGEFLGTLFGMSMFDWLGPDEDDNDSGAGSEGNIPRFGQHFWPYWATAIPLTLVILFIWRAWWVAQDRYFRRHLSKELSEERFWTVDGKPRQLAHGFMYDFIYLSARRDERTRADDELDELRTVGSTIKENYEGGPSTRQRQILAARKWSLNQRSSAVSV